jgi:hypothetical protein
MKTRIHGSPRAPEPARLAARALKRLDYVDSYSMRVPPSAPAADELLIQAFSDLPGWVMALLRLRNRVVSVFGLKTGDDTRPLHSELPLQPGGFLGFFSVRARETCEECDEVLVGADDKHLEACVSGLCAHDSDGERRFALTTVVEFHNLLGRLYFVPVKPFHRLIVRDMLRRLARRLEIGALGHAQGGTPS